MKFRFLLLAVLGHSIVCSYNSKRYFTVIFNSHAWTETIKGEPLPPLLPSQKAGKEACDVTGRDPKSSQPGLGR